MATTTNYSWTTPDDTALVKDGASAIRALGTAIDTSMNTALGTKKAGMVLLNTTSFSGVSAQNVDSLFSSTYENYKILIRALHSSGDMKMQGRVAGSTIATDYGYQTLRGDNVSASAARTFATDWFVAETSANKSQIVIELGGPNVAEKTTGFVTQSRSANSINVVSLLHDLTSQFDGIRLFPTSGTMTGTVSVYGYAK